MARAYIKTLEDGAYVGELTYSDGSKELIGPFATAGACRGMISTYIGRTDYEHKWYGGRQIIDHRTLVATDWKEV